MIIYILYAILYLCILSHCTVKGRANCMEESEKGAEKFDQGRDYISKL